MNRAALGFVALALLTGCRSQGPYALFGQTTIPPPNLTATAPTGYYPPPAGLPGQPATVPPTIELPPASARPSLGSTPIPQNDLAPATLPAKPAPSPSFASRDNFAAEEPIRIVEAAPSAATGKFSSVLPFREPAPPAVVRAAPAATFNPSGSAADVSQLPRPGIHAPATSPAIDRTRGFIPAQPATTPAGASGSFRTDPAVRPTGYVEAIPSPAAGTWRAR